MIYFYCLFIRFLSHMHTDFCGLSFHAICWDTNLSNSTSMLPKAVGASISMLHEAIGACANEYLLKSVGCHRIFLNACGGLLWRRSPRRRVWYLVYVCIGSGRQSECDCRLRPKFERTRQKPKLSNMKKIVWRWSTFSQTARSYSQDIFLRFLVLFVVRFPSRSYSEISVLKTLLHFRILFRAAAHLKRRVRRDIWNICIYCDRLDARFFLFCVVVHSEHSHLKQGGKQGESFKKTERLIPSLREINLMKNLSASPNLYFRGVISGSG